MQHEYDVAVLVEKVYRVRAPNWRAAVVIARERYDAGEDPEVERCSDEDERVVKVESPYVRGVSRSCR